jgi:hypothetical protein
MKEEFIKIQWNLSLKLEKLQLFRNLKKLLERELELRNL